MVLMNLSDPQEKEISTLFRFFDRDRDGLISPRSAVKLCEILGFHYQQERSMPGESGGMPLTEDDMLSWVDHFVGQMNRNEELRLSQRVTLLRSCDVDADARPGHKVTKESILEFLKAEGHSVRPEMVDMLMDEYGTNGQMSKFELGQLLGTKSRRSGSASRERGGSAGTSR